MNGYGIFKFQDGKQYEGQYSVDKKHGYGIFTWVNGKRYEGWWTNGKQNGYGMMVNQKKIQYGEWKEGQKLVIFTGDQANKVIKDCELVRQNAIR